MVVPFVNVDTYTLNLKTNADRRQNLGTCDGLCNGVDLNRNFDNDWYQNNFAVPTIDPKNDTGGDSIHPEELYRYNFGGSYRAFSEPESRAVRPVVQDWSHTP